MRFTLCLFLFLCLKQTNAQSGEDSPFKYFGFQAGVNISNMNFNDGEPPPPSHVSSSWKPGFTFGFMLQVPLAHDLTLQPEFSYTQRNGGDKSMGIDYSADYLSIPLLLNYRISSRLALIAGPQVELLIDARSGYQGLSANITHDVEERSFGITGGFEVNIIGSFFISGRYFQGLNHIGIGQRSDVKEFRYQVVNIVTGIRF